MNHQLKKLSKLKISTNVGRPVFNKEISERSGYGLVAEKTNFKYIKEILGFSIKEICDIQNLHKVCLFIATKHDRIFECMINYPSDRNIFLIKEILMNEIYPYIDESVYLEKYNIKKNIKYKLEKWIANIIICNYTLNEKDISSCININIFINSFKKYFLLHEICWNSIILKFINENINNIFKYINWIHKNKNKINILEG